jgi:hypothetical protein
MHCKSADERPARDVKKSPGNTGAFEVRTLGVRVGGTMDNGRPQGFEGAAAMRVLENNYGWNPIETAPLEEDVSLEVTDGRGAPYRLPNPCRRTASGWVSSSKGTPLAVTPVRWKPVPAGSWKS